MIIIVTIMFLCNEVLQWQYAVCRLMNLSSWRKVTLNPLKRHLGLVAACPHWQVPVVILYLYLYLIPLNWNCRLGHYLRYLRGI